MTEMPNPYAAPVASVAPIAAPLPEPRGWTRRALLRSNVCLALSLGVGAAGIAASGSVQSRTFDGVAFAAVALLSAVGAFFAVASLVRAFTAPGKQARPILGGVALLVVHGAMTLFGALLALLSQSGGRGRQLRRFGRVLLPGLRAGDEWSRGHAPVDVDVSVRDALAARWRENAKTEHASVAAFARLTLDLVALGAPPELLASAQSDGLDEIRHAQLCFALATAIDGRHVSPSPFPAALRARTLPRARTLALAALAVDSLVDGALHEGVSARVIARLARTAEVPAIRELLARLAADEGRHAANGWHVVDWCVREGGAPVVRALEGAVRILPATPAIPVPARQAHGAGLVSLSAPEDGSWERWGIPGRALEADEHAKARAHIVRRVAALSAAADAANAA
ncbi:MAG TPA: ferritin-like domain-containing protein [Polyangiaceae bacterium]